jgi:DHA2 family multidrug resistance protein
LQGFGLGMIFVPLSVIGFSTLPDELKVDASGLFSLLRTIGSSMGIAIIITIFTRHTQTAWNQLGGFIHPYNSAVSMYLNHLHLSPHSPQAAAVLGAELGKQAQMLSAISTFAFIMWSFVSVLPFLLLFRRVKNK